MVAYFLLGTALLLSLLLLARWLAAADTGSLVKGMRYGGGAAAAGLALYLVVSGRWPMAIAALSTVLPLVMRWRFASDRIKAARGPRPGQRSEVETAFLSMTLDHDTGEMSGAVLAGSQAGRPLADMSLAELASLLEECAAHDGQSVSLLESYLVRRFGADWRDAAGGGGAKAAPGGAAGGEGRRRSSNEMTRGEALEILGLKEGAAPEDIKDAYRRLMLKLHPDAGGSGYLAAKLNQAKDVLLGG